MIVGHSMAGVTVPGVVANSVRSRVREMILAAAFVPPQGSAIVDTLGGPLAGLRPACREGRQAVKVPQLGDALRVLQRHDTRTKRLTMSKLYAESARIPAEPVDRSDMPDDVPRTWILTTRDRALSQKSQHPSIEALGGVQEVISIDACHEVMFSHPERLAEILIQRCRLRG